MKCEAEDLKLEELIGATGFSGEDKAMGVIERISPVFLENKDGLYYEAGIDYQVSPENRQGYLEYKQIAGKWLFWLKQRSIFLIYRNMN